MSTLLKLKVFLLAFESSELTNSVHVLAEFRGRSVDVADVHCFLDARYMCECASSLFLLPHSLLARTLHPSGCVCVCLCAW